MHDAISIIFASRARLTVALALVAAVIAGGVTFGSWAVGSDPGNGYAKAKSSANLTLSDASASTTAQLFPGGTGDVLVKVTNPNPFAVTITAIVLPGASQLAAGFRDPQLRSPKPGCGPANSQVTWSDSTSQPSVHTLDQPLTVGSRTSTTGVLDVRLTGAVTMGSGTPAACAQTFFALPSLTGVRASASSRPPTPSPIADRWVS